jgi:hypothetical protein
MMILPKDAFMVLQDEAPEQTEFKSSLILSMADIDKKPEKPNTGTIKYAGENAKQYIGGKVTFRANFADPMEIDMYGESLLYFRDFESSIYYVTKD